MDGKHQKTEQQGGPVPCHVMASRAMPGHMFACHAIFFRVMPCHDHSVPFHVRIFSGKMAPGCFEKCQKDMPALCQEYMLFFCLPLSSQPRLRLLKPAPWLTTQWQTEKSHILLALDGHIFLTCLQLVGAWVQNMFRNFVPDCWTSRHFFLLQSWASFFDP